VPDLGFGFPGATLVELEKWGLEYDLHIADNVPALGITVINWAAQYRIFQNQEIYEQACAHAAEMFIAATGGKVYFFPQVFGPTRSQDDRLISARIARQLHADPEHVVLITQPIPPAILKSIYGRMTVFLGTRMHSNIFAISAGTPVLAIGYLHKTAGIMQMLGLEHWVVDINTVDAALLSSRLAELLTARAGVAADIQSKLPEIVAQCDQAGSLIYTDYKAQANHAHA
jgi:colanic acid/amylovoran biosynthesis protein